MSTAVPKHEAIKQALTPERTRFAGTSKEQRARKLAEGMRERANTAGNDAWREALHTRIRKPISPDEIDNAIDKVHNPARQANIRSRAELYKNFLEKGGYDKLPTSIEKSMLITDVWAMAESNPLLGPEINAMTIPQKIAFAERIIRSGQFEDLLYQSFDSIRNLEGIETIDIDDIKDQKNIAQQERDNQNDKVTDLERRSSSLKTRLDDFEPATGTGPAGSKYTRMETLRTDMHTIKSERDTFKSQLDSAEIDLKYLEQELVMATKSGGSRAYGGRSVTDISTDITAKRGQITTFRTQVTTREAKIQELEQLETEEKKLREDKKSADQDTQEAKVELTKSQAKLDKLDRQLAEAQAKQERIEKKIESGFTGAAQEAAFKWIQADVDRLQTAMDAELEEMGKNTTDVAKKDFYDKLKARYTTTRTRRGFLWLGNRKEPTHDRAKIQADFNKILTGSPADVINDITAAYKASLSGKTNPETGSVYQASEIDALMKKLTSDTELQQEVAQQIVNRQFLANGVSSEEYNVLLDKDWADKVIDPAIDYVKQQKERRKKGVDEGIMKRASYLSRFAYKFGEHRWTFGRLLLGSLIFAAAMAPEDETRMA